MLSGRNAGGNFAHIGGALAGYMFAFLLGKGIDVTNVINAPVDWIKRLFKGEAFRRKRKPKFTYTGNAKRSADYEYNARKKTSEAEIDAILEKIKKGGYSSLTEAEKKRLFEASR
jgi:hypothetical protein